jgi:DoxX-like family
MFLVYLVVTVVTILANAWAAFADFAHVRFVDKNMAEMGVPRSWLPVLAIVKAAGAVGLGLGVLNVPLIGTAAAAGLVVFFLGALVAHVRARVFYNIAFPGAYLALAAGSLALSVAR